MFTLSKVKNTFAKGSSLLSKYNKFTYSLLSHSHNSIQQIHFH